MGKENVATDMAFEPGSWWDVKQGQSLHGGEYRQEHGAQPQRRAAGRLAGVCTGVGSASVTWPWARRSRANCSLK